ncbi:hypothetical protein DXH78_01295 [Undibacter mobilis]|uniref:Uncharacterized protein n=1 Tax=Undibacter mobilis TaxID=2292256 RepID=A0A371B7J8_9BRAD|nr:hypothetical protein DXH78_01295 [Undibacter mobilis]
MTVNGGQNAYSLDAVVFVPNGCYFGNGAQRGVPLGLSVTPETESVILHLGRHEGVMCTQGVTPVRFQLAGIPISLGKTRLTAFVVMNGVVVGASSIAVPSGNESELAALTTLVAPQRSGAWIGPGEVGGWINRMPIGPSSVHIRVGMWAPTSGYLYRLTMVGPFGFTGRTLLCDLLATRPSGIALDVICHTIVPADGPLGPAEQYDSVLVRFEGTLAGGRLNEVS